MSKTWTREEHSYLQRLVEKSKRKTWGKFAEDMSKVFKEPYSSEQVRSYWRTKIRGTQTPVVPEYKETVEILANGSVKSDRLVKLSLEEAKDEQYLLEAHGFDASEWTIDRAKNSQWNQHNKHDGTVTLFSSSITVKKRPKGELTEADFMEVFARRNEPIEIPVNYIGDNNLVIGLPDLHFGITRIEDLYHKLDDIKAILQNGYKTVVLEQLGDLFHSSQMKSSQTLKGTLLEDIDMVKAIDDAKIFFDVILVEALKHGREVIVEHAGGNHSDNMEYMFLVYLEAKYPDVTINKHNEFRSAYLLDNVGIMITHGDNANKKLPQLFATEFKMIWAQAETMEIHTGHRHTFEKDIDGVILRQFGTVKPNDAYEVRNGWTSNRKVIQCIEYDSDRPKVIYEV